MSEDVKVDCLLVSIELGRQMVLKLCEKLLLIHVWQLTIEYADRHSTRTQDKKVLDELRVGSKTSQRYPHSRIGVIYGASATDRGA
jgi:hypothetical protein